VNAFRPLVHASGIADGPTAVGIGAMPVAAYLPCTILLPWLTVPRASKKPSRS
jgi:hypothetical protein